MSLPPGTRLGPYEVLAALGAGGMGEVYRARDTKLNRDVALKVLPAAVGSDPDRLSRFTREAQTLALLNHPNIAQIYGFEEAVGVGALVMELVEGEDLSQRLARGPIPLDDAVRVARQIAEALEAAHERGIVHRDLKPANVKLRPDGTVKVLDFGLAKALESAPPAPIDVSASPTFISPGATRAGIILGTAAYMSPEQARGAQVDKRTDVWAFGCVLFEMLAGRHVFGASGTVSDAIAGVLKSEPDWQALPADTPPQMRSLLKRCLEKDPRHRLRDIGDAGLLLADSSSLTEAVSPKPRETSSARSTWLRWTAVAGWFVAATLAMANVNWIAGGSRPASTQPVPALRLALPFPSEFVAAANSNASLRSFAISNDSTHLVYLSRGSSSGSALVLQDLVSGELKRLDETDGAYAPVFSPDGQEVAFAAGSTIKVLRVDGGLPRSVAPAAGWEHWAWNGPGHLVLAGSTGLLRVAVNGGVPEPIAKLGPGEALFTSAFALPGGAYLVSVRTATGTDDSSRVVVVGPGASDRLVLAERAGSSTFVAGSEPGLGHVVYAEAGRLIALPFDAVRRVVKGGAVPIVENVAMRANGDLADYASSGSGTLVYREGSLHELVWVDRAGGAVRPLTTHLRRFALPRLSSDGRHLAMEIQDSPHQIWTLDIERDVLVPLTTESTGSHNFAWAPDGRAIVYTQHLTPPQLGWIRTDGSGRSEKIPVKSDSRVHVGHWSHDGRLALTFEGSPGAIMMLPLEEGTPPRPRGSPAKVADGNASKFSPDGGWLSFTAGDRPSNVFIQHLETGARFQVSTGGGSDPTWAASARELFFRAGSRMMVVELSFNGPSVRIGRPQTLFEGDYFDSGYDVTADGKRFVMVRIANANTRSLAVRLNWPAELERLAPTQR